MNTGLLSFPNNLGAQDLYNTIRPPSVLLNNVVTQATPNNHYIFVNNSLTTSLVLPFNPIPGSVLWVTNVSTLFTHFCNRNGQRINGLAEDLFMDLDYRVTILRWIDSETGWIVI